MKNEFGLEGGGIDLTELDVNEISELVEKLKTKSVVIKLMNVFKEKTPHLYAALVTERDAYMAIGLDSQPQFKSVVAVMGMGHVNGVSQYLRSLGWQELPSVCESPSLVTYTV
jgi:pheromone shutdown protein TraB